MNCALQRRMLELYLYGQNSITNTHMNRPVNKQTSMVGPYELFMHMFMKIREWPKYALRSN